MVNELKAAYTEAAAPAPDQLQFDLWQFNRFDNTNHSINKSI